MFQALLRNVWFLSTGTLSRSGQAFEAEFRALQFRLIVLRLVSYPPPLVRLREKATAWREGYEEVVSKRRNEKTRVALRVSFLFCSPTYPTPLRERPREGKRRNKPDKRVKEDRWKESGLNLVMWSPKETWKNRYRRLTFHSSLFERVNSPRSPEKQSPEQESEVRVATSKERSYEILPSGGIRFFTGPGTISDVSHFLCLLFFPNIHANFDK